MPWDARSCRVFLEIPDKSWCCYLAFDSFPCMEAESSWFFLCSALAHPVLGAGLTPLHQSSRIAQLESPGEAPLQVHENPPWTHGCWMPKVPWGRWVGAQLSHTPGTPPRLEGGAPARPPHPSMDSSQASFTYLHP